MYNNVESKVIAISEDSNIREIKREKKKKKQGTMVRQKYGEKKGYEGKNPKLTEFLLFFYLSQKL